MISHDLDDLRSELDDYAKPQTLASRTPREERIIAGFEDIERFVEENGCLPQHGEDKDIFERLYAIRLDKIRTSNECQILLKDLDKKGLLDSKFLNNTEELDDDVLLSELGVKLDAEQDILNIKHVKTRLERNSAEEIAQRIPCKDFEGFKPLFLRAQDDLIRGLRSTKKCENKTSINVGNFFILYGQKAYIAEVGTKFQNSHKRQDARLRVIFDNGTENNMLLTSLQRALYKDDNCRRITDTQSGPLFSSELEENDVESGLIYVLRSKSDHPEIKKHYQVLHKIGVTSNDIEKRISNAKNDPTFLMAEVEVVATYKLSNINKIKFEGLIHKFFESAQLNIKIMDRFGKPIIPREWYLVPLFVIDEVIERIKLGTITQVQYDVNLAQIVEQK